MTWSHRLAVSSPCAAACGWCRCLHSSSWAGMPIQGGGSGLSHATCALSAAPIAQQAACKGASAPGAGVSSQTACLAHHSSARLSVQPSCCRAASVRAAPPHRASCWCDREPWHQSLSRQRRRTTNSGTISPACSAWACRTMAGSSANTSACAPSSGITLHSPSCAWCAGNTRARLECLTAACAGPVPAQGRARPRSADAEVGGRTCQSAA